jgi:hypothetical protein
MSCADARIHIEHNAARRSSSVHEIDPLARKVSQCLKEKLIKIGAKVISHGRSIAFQMAEVAIPRHLFQEILRLIAELRPQPPPATA